MAQSSNNENLNWAINFYSFPFIIQHFLISGIVCIEKNIVNDIYFPSDNLETMHSY